MLVLLSLWRAAAAASGTVSSFTGTAALLQGEAASVSGGLTSFSGAAALRQGEALAAIGVLTSFLGMSSARQGEVVTVAGLASSFVGSGALQDSTGPPMFAAAGLVSSFQGEAAITETVVIRPAGKRPTRLRRPLLEWSDGVPQAPRATSFNAFIAYGAVTSFAGSAAISQGVQAAGDGALAGFTGAAAANSDLYLEDDELILLALAA